MNARRWILFGVGLFVLLIIPRVLGIVKTNTFVEFAISAMYAVSLNLLLSAGLLSFGHSLFFGAGAYATALGLLHIQGFPLLPALLLGGLVAGLIGLLLSPLLVRVSGTALIMLTLAFSQLMYVLCLKFREVTGGEDGLAGYPIPPLNIPAVGSIDMVNPTYFYYFAVAVVILGIAIMWFVTRTPFGSIMISIRDNQNRVDYLGFRVPVTKAIVIGISGFFAGIAGSLFALFQNVVAVDSVLHIMVSFAPLMAILVGGIGTFAGPIIGAGALLFVEEISVRFLGRVELVSGLVFILIVLYAPGGLMGLYGKWRERRMARRSSLAVAERIP